jgi:hypothetical protein
VRRWMVLDVRDYVVYKARSICTLLFLLHLRKVLPFHQNKMPNRHHVVINAAFVMIGAMNLFSC